MVIQSGTRVMEMRNVGTFDTPFRVENEIPAEIQVPKMIDICNKFQVLMKEHNTDYLSNEALSWHPRLGIHAANVAPEFGVTETKSLVQIMKKFNLNKKLEKFLEISFSSRKWEKWMIKNSKANDYEKSIIAGHYIYSKPEFIELKKEIEFLLRKHRNINLNVHLKNEVKKSILRYLTNSKFAYSDYMISNIHYKGKDRFNILLLLMQRAIQTAFHLGFEDFWFMTKDKGMLKRCKALGINVSEDPYYLICTAKENKNIK